MNSQRESISRERIEDQLGIGNFVDLLRLRAKVSPTATAYVFLPDGETEGPRTTFARLDQHARAIAAELQSMKTMGQRALLLYPPGLEYIDAFFGCLYAGVVAVPAYPPARHHLSRLYGILQDAMPAVVMTTAEIQARLIEGFVGIKQADKLRWLVTDTLNTTTADVWTPPELNTGSLAFLQYTSGSTGQPKGVMVSHGNLLANQRAIKASFNHDENTVVVGWLPLYHDMGLIGNILQPLYLGTPAILMPPLAFMDQPLRWLQAISRYHATTSGGPNFAYELCLRKVTAEQKRALDLHSWKIAFNGAEPVRASTINRFGAAFAECGFRREAFFPCYGLAEATLFVTGPDAKSPLKLRPGITSADKDLNSTTAISLDQSKPLVGCGHVWNNHEVKIVDPDTRQLCAEGHIGEIWISGPSIAEGYWNKPEESMSVFKAKLENNNERTFLRTGDLGLLQQRELYVTGRIKDLIIVHGRNYYPQDFEQALDEQAEFLRPGCNAAFSTVIDNEEKLIIVAEVRRPSFVREQERNIFDGLYQALALASDATVHTIVLVPPGTIPKTSSGKIRRQACKEAYLNNDLKILARSDEAIVVSPWGSIDFTSTDLADGIARDTFINLPIQQRVPLIKRLLTTKTAQLLKLPEANIEVNRPVCSLGIH